MATPDTGGQGILGLTSLFGGLGILGGPRDISSSDAGIGVDGSEVAAQALSDSDSGIGVEGTESIAISNVASTDKGTVGEVESLDITLKGSADHKDVGVGVDTESYQVLITSLDSGVGVDTENDAITSSFVDTDLGSVKETEAVTFDRKLTITIDSISQALDMTITYEGG